MRNLEAKFRLEDLDAACATALALGYAPSANFIQHDTFFAVAHGKLKLREQPPDAWLIHYARSRESALMLSRYEIVPIAAPGRARAMLECALGIIAEVHKSRTLLMRDNVRLHLDRVEGLGDFGEIEAVIAEGDDPEQSRPAVDELIEALRIPREELIEASYFELAARSRKS